MSINYKDKYIKYKNKYLNLIGGSCNHIFYIYVYNAQNMDKYLFEKTKDKESILDLILKDIPPDFINIKIILYDPFNRINIIYKTVNGRKIQLMYMNTPINRNIMKHWKPYLILDFNIFPPCDNDHDRTNSIYFEPIYNDDQYISLPIFDTPLFQVEFDNNITILKNRPQKIIDIPKSIKLQTYIYTDLATWAKKSETIKYFYTQDGFIYNNDNNFLCLGANRLINPFNDNENMILPAKSEYISIKYYNDIIGHIFIRNSSLIYNKSAAKKIWMKKGVNDQVKFYDASMDIGKIQKAVQQMDPKSLLVLLFKIVDDNINSNNENIINYVTNIPYDSINQLIIYFERLKKDNNSILFNKCLNLLKMLESVNILFNNRRDIREDKFFPNINLKENLQFKSKLKDMLREIASKANLTYPQIEKKIFELVLEYYNK